MFSKGQANWLIEKGFQLDIFIAERLNTAKYFA